MNCDFDSRRAFCSTAVVVGSLLLLSGCKHIHRGDGVEASVSGPYMRPYHGDTSLDTPVQSEPLPELSPVPPRSGAGHSVPPEPLPPPPPPAPAEPNSARAEPGRPAGLQTRSRWSQLSARASTGRLASGSPLPPLRQGRHAAIASMGVSNRATDPRFAAFPVGVSTATPRTNSIDSRIGETTAGGGHSFDNQAGGPHGRYIEAVSTPTWRSGPSFPVSQPTLDGAVSREPAIVPMQQPIVTRNGVIEHWPYRSQPPTFLADSVKDASPKPANAVPTTPSNETRFGSTEPAPFAAREETTAVPSLLPPGP